MWTRAGLLTFHVLFLIRLATGEVHIAGIIPSPDEAWMKRAAVNLTMADLGFLRSGDRLLHDRDGKFCPAFRAILQTAGVEPMALPPRSPNLNAFAERWVSSVQHECLDRLVLFGEGSLRRCVREYVLHYHHERNHQGLENRLPLPRERDRIGAARGTVRRWERLGGLLGFYLRIAG